MMERDNLKCEGVKTMEEEFKKLRVKVESGRTRETASMLLRRTL